MGRLYLGKNGSPFVMFCFFVFWPLFYPPHPPFRHSREIHSRYSVTGTYSLRMQALVESSVRVCLGSGSVRSRLSKILCKKQDCITVDNVKVQMAHKMKSVFQLSI